MSSKYKPSMLTTSIRRRKPITSSDIITVKGRHLLLHDNERFFIKGIGFPTPPPSQTKHYYSNDTTSFNNNNTQQDERYLSGWNAVLDQLATETDINTVRLYVMDCRYDYTSFIQHAAELGIIVVNGKIVSDWRYAIHRTIRHRKAKHV